MKLFFSALACCCLALAHANAGCTVTVTLAPEKAHLFDGFSIVLEEEMEAGFLPCVRDDQSSESRSDLLTAFGNALLVLSFSS